LSCEDARRMGKRLLCLVIYSIRRRRRVLIIHFFPFHSPFLFLFFWMIYSKRRKKKKEWIDKKNELFGSFSTLTLLYNHSICKNMHRQWMCVCVFSDSMRNKYMGYNNNKKRKRKEETKNLIYLNEYINKFSKICLTYFYKYEYII
jgi:hypothetical protein